MSDIFGGGGGNGIPQTGLGQILAAFGQGMASANNAAAAEPILRAQAAARAAQMGQPAPPVPAPTPSLFDRLTSMFGGGGQQSSQGLGSLASPSPSPATGGQSAGLLGSLLGLRPPVPQQPPQIPQPMARLDAPTPAAPGVTPNAPLGYAATSPGAGGGLSTLVSPASPPPALPPALGGRETNISPRAVAYQASQPATSPGAPANGPLPTFAQTQGTNPGVGPGQWFGGLEQRFNLPQGYLASTMAIEDPSGDPNATSSTGAKGPFQFTKGTAQAYGLTDPTNFGASAYAAAQLANDNANQLRQALGRDPTGPELYLAHQQGAGAAAALIANPNVPAGQVLASIGANPRNIAVNGGNPNAPAGAFTAMWAAKYGQPGAIGGLAAPGQTQVASAQPGSPFGSLVGARAALGQGNGLPAMAMAGAPGLSPATPFPAAGAPGANLGPGSVGQQTGAMSFAPPGQAANAPAAQAIGNAAPAGPVLSAPSATTSSAYDPNDPPVTVKGFKGTWTQKSAAATESDDSPEVDDVKAAQAAAAGQPAPSYAPPAPPVPSVVGNMPAGATSPIGRQFEITPDMIRSLVTNPGTQQMGLELLKWQVENQKAPTVYHAGDYVQMPSGQWLSFPTKPDTTDAIKNYQYEQSQGYTKSFQSYQIDQQKADKATLADVPLPNGQMQKVWMTPGQDPSKGTPVGAPYTPKPAVAIDQKAESASESEFGKAVGQDMGATLQAGSSAPQALQQLGIMRAAAVQAGNSLSTGPLAQYVLKGKQALGNVLGVEIPGTSEAEVINNLGYGLATQAARAISNRPTQFEFGQALAVKPGLAQSPQGFQAVLNVKEQDLQDQQNLARLLADPANRGPQWPQVKAQYYASHPIMSPFDPSKPLGQADVDALNAASASAPTPPGVPAGARQGNDGNWYVPDPSRAGKFMRVNR